MLNLHIILLYLRYISGEGWLKMSYGEGGCKRQNTDIWGRGSKIAQKPLCDIFMFHNVLTTDIDFIGPMRSYLVKFQAAILHQGRSQTRGAAPMKNISGGPHTLTKSDH